MARRDHRANRVFKGVRALKVRWVRRACRVIPDATVLPVHPGFKARWESKVCQGLKALPAHPGLKENPALKGGREFSSYWTP